MARKLFCEICPLTYQISTWKCQLQRDVRDMFSKERLAREKQSEPLPVLVYQHKSLIRRQLGEVDMVLQENKAVNLSLAAPHIDGILIHPGETFSFWRLVGNPTAKKGYREGLTIAGSKTSKGIGGGMCQFTNLLHWMILHTPLEITEHHHHDGFDLFPDFNRQIPFGTGTSILYNYLDYRFRNTTGNTYQILVTVGERYLCGELRALEPQEHTYHIYPRKERFVQEGKDVYRCGEGWRDTSDVRTGEHIRQELLRENHARVLYNTSGLIVEKNIDV